MRMRRNFEAKFRVLSLAVGLEVLADCNNLFHEVSKVFWDVGDEAYKRISVKQSRIGEQTMEEEGEEGRTLSLEDTEGLTEMS